jgi:hypothetical protein
MAQQTAWVKLPSSPFDVRGIVYKGLDIILKDLEQGRRFSNSQVHSIYVFLSSTGTPGNSIEEEGERFLYRDPPPLCHPEPTVKDDLIILPYTKLSLSERGPLFPHAKEVYNAQDGSFLVQEVEKGLQLAVEKVARAYGLIVLWKFPGKGAPQGTAPFKVGYRLFPHCRNGKLPHGIVRSFKRTDGI